MMNRQLACYLRMLQKQVVDSMRRSEQMVLTGGADPLSPVREVRDFISGNIEILERECEPEPTDGGKGA